MAREGVEWRRARERLRIGWNEYVSLPDWGVTRIRAKMDTGARSSALHVENIQELPRGHVRFDVILHRKSHRRVHVATRIRRRGRVRSSTGHYSERIFVSTRMRIGPVEREVELSLVDRGLMIYRMLLGRTALSGLLVDVNHARLLGRPPRRKLKRRRKKGTRPVG